MAKAIPKKRIKINRCIGPGPKKSSKSCSTMLPTGRHICESCQRRINDLRIGSNLEVREPFVKRSYFAD